ncbi:hypothetical protein HZS_7599 [Henneguya salminicola]|nr:hypothetical protein HZS_7599 [Henneguya salminicola]
MNFISNIKPENIEYLKIQNVNDPKYETFIEYFIETWMKKYPKQLGNYSKHNEQIISRTITRLNHIIVE